MKKELTNSTVDRQNILNNNFAIQEIGKQLKLNGVMFEGTIRFTKEQLADYFGISMRTIERYLDEFSKELTYNGYKVLGAKKLKLFIETCLASDSATDIHVGRLTSNLGIFNFRSLLNLAMLLKESEKARTLRQVILNITIETINKITGGNTEFINQRDADFLEGSFREQDYRKEFTTALKLFVWGDKIKFPIFTNFIYKAIFKENAKEYRNILRLEKKDKIRDTLYTEVLDIIASFETGFAERLENEYVKTQKKLSFEDAKRIFSEMSKEAHWKPLIEKARNKMASRDYFFRDALHERIKHYVTPITREDYEKFLGERSLDLEKQLEQAKNVLKRLKE